MFRGHGVTPEGVAGKIHALAAPNASSKSVQFYRSRRADFKEYQHKGLN